MSELFSDEWMKSFQTVWNADAGIAGELEKIGFKSTIGYGFKGAVTSFCIAYISKKLQIIVGDCGAMMKNFRTSFSITNELAVDGEGIIK